MEEASSATFLQAPHVAKEIKHGCSSISFHFFWLYPKQVCNIHSKYHFQSKLQQKAARCQSFPRHALPRAYSAPYWIGWWKMHRPCQEGQKWPASNGRRWKWPKDTTKPGVPPEYFVFWSDCWHGWWWCSMIGDEKSLLVTLECNKTISMRISGYFPSFWSPEFSGHVANMFGAGSRSVASWSAGKLK